jgi:hypothetical protein
MGLSEGSGQSHLAVHGQGRTELYMGDVYLYLGVSGQSGGKASHLDDWLLFGGQESPEHETTN